MVSCFDIADSYYTEFLSPRPTFCPKCLLVQLDRSLDVCLCESRIEMKQVRLRRSIHSSLPFLFSPYVQTEADATFV